MKCPKCQHENPEDAVFCNECACKLEAICPECGKANPPNSKFCNKCAFDLRKEKPNAIINYLEPQSYTPKHLAEKILTTRSSLEGERKIVTVLFADVANYTSMSEKLDPEEVLQIMDGAFKIMMDETHKYEGTINQFTGDGIMAIFGAPVAHENHAQRACYTALSIQNAMTDYSAKIEAEYGIVFKIRIGINSGPVIVSAIGDDLRMDYTAVGDTTNLAARMEGSADPGTIRVSGNTHKIVERYFEFNHIGRTDVKGKEEPQDIYELLKASEVVTRIEESVAKGLTRFVGRKNSMAALMEAYELAKSGAGQVLGVVGEAGVGKSRLILEFRNHIIQERNIWLEGQCLQYGGSILYKPILDILKSIFDIKENDREHIVRKKIKDRISPYKDLETSLHSFQDLLSIKLEDEAFLKLEPKQKREKAFDAIRDLLISLSQEKTLVIVVEDLHWIDDTSEEFVNYFIEWIAKTRILLILPYRTEYQHKWGSKTYYHKIGLDHLGKESAIELVKAMLEDGNIAPELRDLILSRAAGNPLFMEEFTHTLIENGTIQKQDNQFVLSRDIKEIHVPDTVQGIISARMDRLEENLKRTIQVASVIGRDFAFRILQTITGMREELKSYLLNLQGLEFIYEKRLFPELEYIFKHALTQEVAYNSLLLKRRKQIHENTGKAIEELYSDRLEEFYEMLAYHYSKSDNFEKAYQFLKLSGEKAFSNYAIEESYRYYLEALRVLDKMPHIEKNIKCKIEVIQLIHGSMFLLGFPEGSLRILQSGEQLAKEIKDKNSLSAIYSMIITYYTNKGNPLEGRQYSEALIYDALKNEDIELISSILPGILMSYDASGDYLKIVDMAPIAISLLETKKIEADTYSGNMNVYSYICSVYGLSLAYTGNFDEGKKYLKKAMRLARNIEDITHQGFCEVHYGQYCLWKGDGKGVIEHYQKCINIYEKMNYMMVIGFSYGCIGCGYYLRGDLEKAKKNVEQGYSIHNKSGVNWLRPIYPLYTSFIYHDLYDYAEALKFAKEALSLSKKDNAKHFEEQSRIWVGRVLFKKENSKSAEAEKYLMQGIKKLEELNHRPFIAWGYFFLGELYADTGRKDEALENLNKALSMCQEMGIEYWPDKIQAVLDRL